MIHAGGGVQAAGAAARVLALRAVTSRQSSYPAVASAVLGRRTVLLPDTFTGGGPTRPVLSDG